jgi:hypothetical protein
MHGSEGGGAQQCAPPTRLGDDHARDAFTDAGDAGQQLDLRGERVDQPGHRVFPDPADLLLDLGQHLVEVVDTGQVQCHQVAVVVGEPPGQGQAQIVGLVAQHPSGQTGQDHRIAFAIDEGVEHQSAGDPEGVRSHVVQLDPGRFQHLEQPLLLPATFLCQLGLVPGEVPHRPDLFRGQETAPQQTNLHQLGQPLRILHIRFPARDRLDMRGVDHLNGQVRAADLPQRRVHRPPVRAGGLHRHMRDSTFEHQPGRHLKQFPVERAKRAGGLPPRRTLGIRGTCGHRDLPLVHINATHMGIQDLQRASVPTKPARAAPLAKPVTDS